MNSRMVLGKPAATLGKSIIVMEKTLKELMSLRRLVVMIIVGLV